MTIPVFLRPGTYDLPFIEGEKFDKVFELQAPIIDVNGDPVRDVRGVPTYQPLETTGWTGSFKIKTRRDGNLVVGVTEDSLGTDGYLVISNSQIEVVIYAVKTFLIKPAMFYELFAGSPSDQRKWLGGLTTKER